VLTLSSPLYIRWASSVLFILEAFEIGVSPSLSLMKGSAPLFKRYSIVSKIDYSRVGSLTDTQKCKGVSPFIFFLLISSPLKFSLLTCLIKTQAIKFDSI